MAMPLSKNATVMFFSSSSRVMLALTIGYLLGCVCAR